MAARTEKGEKEQPPSLVFSLRLEPELIKRIDAVTHRKVRVLSGLGLLAPAYGMGLGPTRAQTVRWIIEEGLKVTEKTLEREERKRKRGGAQ
jgi:hypothetical protein